MRMRNKPWAKDDLRQNPKVIFGPEEHESPKGQWHKTFGNQNPIHLEIGTGKGQFIVQMAERHPEYNFIAMEKVEEVLIFPADYAVENDIPNLLFVYGNATFLTEYFAPGEVDRIYINFCDPWLKARHHKRRLTHPNFLNMYKQILKPGGEIHLKTDNSELFEYSIEQLNLHGFTVHDVTRDLHRSEYAKDNIMTGYEVKWTNLDIRINRLVAEWTGQ